MSDNRRTFSSIFGILFVLLMASTALGQQPDSALSQSQADKIIEKIDQLEKNILNGMHELELKMRDHVDKKFGELDTKIDDLEAKFHELDKKVAVLKSDVDKLFTIIITIAVAVGVHLLIFVGSYIYSYWRNKTNVVPKVASEDASEAAPEKRDESDEDVIRRSLIDNQPFEPV